MADIFISYAGEDRERVKPLAAAFDYHGFTVWWDTHLRAGETFDEVIEREIRTAASVIVVWSEQSVGRRWVRSEAAEALERDVLVPIKIDNVPLPIAFRLVQTENFVDWTGDMAEDCWRRLILQIDALVARAKGRAPDPAPDVEEIPEEMTAPVSRSAAATPVPESAPQKGPWAAMLQLLWSGILAVATFYVIFVGVYLAQGGSGLSEEATSTIAIPISAAVFIYSLFAIADREISPQNKSIATRWLLPVRGGVKVSAAEAFDNLFETTFGRKHFSWKCFSRSAVASTLFLAFAGLIGAVMALGFGYSLGDYPTYIWPFLLSLILFVAIPNIFADYISLFQTRVFIRWLKKAPILALPLIVIDAILTVAIYLVVLLSFIYFMDFAPGFSKDDLGPQELIAGVATSYITSVWLWLVFFFGPIARVILWSSKTGPTPIGRMLTVQKTPFRTLGFVIALMVFVIGVIVFGGVLTQGCAFGC